MTELAIKKKSATRQPKRRGLLSSQLQGDEDRVSKYSRFLTEKKVTLFASSIFQSQLSLAIKVGSFEDFKSLLENEVDIANGVFCATRAALTRQLLSHGDVHEVQQLFDDMFFFVIEYYKRYLRNLCQTSVTMAWNDLRRHCFRGAEQNRKTTSSREIVQDRFWPLTIMGDALTAQVRFLQECAEKMGQMYPSLSHLKQMVCPHCLSASYCFVAFDMFSIEGEQMCPQSPTIADNDDQPGRASLSKTSSSSRSSFFKKLSSEICHVFSPARRTPSKKELRVRVAEPIAIHRQNSSLPSLRDDGDDSVTTIPVVKSTHKRLCAHCFLVRFCYDYFSRPAHDQIYRQLYKSRDVGRSGVYWCLYGGIQGKKMEAKHVPAGTKYFVDVNSIKVVGGSMIGEGGFVRPKSR
mmetsp:Transcript_4250/g.8442  ORF Transcript_4250/g.8442 Transcript_4250/m.8442 type:complete len:407 (-) Transcript_4250:1448-2668(-)